jgi:Tol biopolymer transport system component
VAHGNAVIAQRAVTVSAAWSVWLWLSASSTTLVTVEQRDAIRSPRSSRTCDVSANGRYVAFESWARLVPADEDARTDIYVLDRTTGFVTLESVGDEESESANPRITGDGRYVVFEKRYLIQALESRIDIVLRDRVSSTLRTLTGSDASLGSWSRSPDISDDGDNVAFSSASTNLVDGTDANGRLEDVYVMRLSSGAIQRVSLNSGGLQFSRGTSILPSLSSDGRWVAFASTAPLSDPAAGPEHVESPVRQVYLRDLVTAKTILVSRPVRGSRPNGDSSVPSLSGDGRYVAFASEASNFSESDGNRGTDIFLFDRETGATKHISRAANGSTASGTSANPAISGDGRYIAFQSDAANLVCASRCLQTQEDINLLWDAFVFDRLTGKTIRVSEDDLGGWMEWSMGPSIDDEGKVVAFSSRHRIDGNDRRDDLDLFVRVLSPLPALTRKAP